jgi:FAD/FMN-containing dehydrogenase
VSATARLLDALRAGVGDAHVLVDDATAAGNNLSSWETDWRRRHRGRAFAVVRPANTQQVAEVVARCAAAQAETGVSIVAQGGNTGLAMGSTPDDSGLQLVLSLQRMQTVRNVDRANLAMTVEAGCVLQNVQAAAAGVECLFPLSLAAEGSCTVGGNLATNAGGTQVVRYGSMRDLCLGLEVVTAQGTVWDGLSGLRKDNTGYDLRHLLIGSEGTLGIITAATLKLVPQPAAQLTAWAAVPHLDAALELLRLAQSQLASGLTGFEVMGRFALSLVVRHHADLTVPLFDAMPWCVLLENSDAESEAHAHARLEALLETAMERGCIGDAVVAANLEQAQRLWRIRESIPLAQATEGPNIKHDISVPISAVPAFVQETDALLLRHFPGVRLVNFGHLGDGNLHYNVQAPAGIDAADFVRRCESAVNAVVFDSVGRAGGSISAEHGIGSLKVDALAARKSPVALEMMRSIKRALDPAQLFNPGRVVRC